MFWKNRKRKVFHDKKELANTFEQRTAKQKETEIRLAAEKVREAFASKTEETQEESATNRPDSIETVQVMPTFKPINIIKKFLSDIQEKKIDKLVNDNYDGDSAKRRRNGQKAINLVESGKANLDNPSILNNYMKVKLFLPEGITDKDGQRRTKTYLEKIEDMTRLGIEPQKPISLIAEDIATKMNKSLNVDEYDLFIHQIEINNRTRELSDTDGSLAKISEIIERYDVPEAYNLIQQRVDIQAFGDKAIGYALEGTKYDIDEKSATTNERIKQSKQGIVFLRKLGYEPFKNGVDSLFSDDGSTKKQIIAESLSLINGDIVDSMYQYKINTLNHIIHNHEQYRDIPILESLKSSGNDAAISFWEQYSRKTGRDELGILAKEAKEHSSNSIFIEMAREYSESDDLKKNPMNYILDNPNILSGPDRGLIITLNNLIAEASNTPKQLENPPYNKSDASHEDAKEQYVRQSIKEAITGILQFQNNKNGEQIPLFDENGITVVAKEMAIFDHSTRLLITKIYPNWGENFSENMQKAIKSKNSERIIAEQPELLAELTPRRRKLVELSKKYPDQLRSYQTSDLTQYFDEDGKILPKLAEDFFIDKSAGNKRNLLCDMPEIYTSLPIEQQEYLKTLHMIGIPKMIDIPKKVANFSSDEILQYFDENGPTEEFWQYEFSLGDFDGIKKYLEKTTTPNENGEIDYKYSKLGLSKNQESIIRFHEEASWFLNDFKKLHQSNELEKYFDENGPTEKFWQYEFSQGNLYDIKEYLKKTTTPNENGEIDYEYSKLGLTKKQESIIRFCTGNTGFFYSNELEKYFNENGPTEEFWQYEFSQGAFSGIKEYLEKTTTPNENGEIDYEYSKLGLTKKQESIIRFYKDAGWFLSDLKNLHQSNELEKYFDENGPTEKFWQYKFSLGDFDGITRYANTIRENSEKTKPSINQSSNTQDLNKIDYTIFGLKDSQIEVLNTYNMLDDVSKYEFRLLISDDYNKIPIDRIKIAPQILSRLALSNSSEITTHRSAIARQLLQINLDNNDEVFKKLEQIEDVFIHNNLPFVGKAFMVFQILHPPTSLESDFNLRGSETISPLLKSLPSYNTQAKTISDIAKNPETVIFSDLLKASFKSNNRSMRRYLENLRIGQNLITSLSSGKISWDRFKQPGDNIEAKIEREALTIFAQHLKTLYNNTDSGRKTPFKLTDNLEQDLTSLVRAFSPNERHKLGDRIVRSFAFFAGIKDLDSAEALLDSTTENATLRNKEAERNGLKLEQGDLIKGIGEIRYLPNILQNGSVSKEFLGDSAGSDATPLDTDLSIILENPDSILAGLETTDAKHYGPIWLVLKGDDNRSGKSRFSITRRSPLEQNQQVEVPEISEKLEAFYTGALSASHYGIRTGFGSSEIDFLVTDNDSTNGTPNSQAVGLEVTLNGFYIPVVDKSSGKVVFSPSDYDALRRKMSGLSYYETGDYQFASDTDLRFGAIEIDGAKVDSIDSIISRLAQNEQEVRKKHEAIDSVIDDALGEIGGLTRKNYIDGDLTEGFVELIDTGSTGRFDNTPGSGDFDYMMRVDKSIMDNPAKLAQISNALLSKLGKTEHAAGEVLDNGNLRLKGVFIKGLDTPVDIDISFTQKTNKVQYSTDMALADRLKSIRKQSPEKHQQVVANIIFAKQFLKAAGSYKPNRGESPQGGLGGVGVENWVLQNGGSFLSAAKEFMSVAEKCENFDEFKTKYVVWDFGENHMAKGERQHDNFVTDNMSAVGYEKMKEALGIFLAQQP